MGNSSALGSLKSAIQRSMALDIFAGSDIIDSTAAGFICNLISAISNQAQRGASAFRFVDELPAEELATLRSQLHSDELPVAVNRQQSKMMLAKTAPRYRAKRKQ